MNDDEVTYVDGPHQHSPGRHVHVRSTDQCIHREAGELCPSWRERAETAEAQVARVTLVARGLEVERMGQSANSYGQGYHDGARDERRLIAVELRGIVGGA